MTEKLLNSQDAVAALSEIGVETSRRMLDQMRAEGDLKWVAARGRVRILYRRADLISAFLSEGEICPSGSTGAAKPAPTGAGAPSREHIFMKARAAARATKR